MSAMELYAVDANGDAVGIGEARNSWGGAMHIWNALYRRWGFGERLPLHRVDETKRFWAHVDAQDVTPLDRVMMLWTFDLAMVKRANIARFVSDLRQWWESNGTSRDMAGNTFNVVDTIPRAAALIEKAFTEDTGLRALLVNHTSVNCDRKWETYDATCECERDEDGEKICGNFDHYQAAAHDGDDQFMDVYEWAQDIVREGGVDA